jgi:hypothetical protein
VAHAPSNDSGEFTAIVFPRVGGKTMDCVSHGYDVAKRDKKPITFLLDEESNCCEFTGIIGRRVRHTLPLGMGILE